MTLDGIPSKARLTPPDASAVFVGFALISVVWYYISGKKHYRGPPIAGLEHELELEA